MSNLKDKLFVQVFEPKTVEGMILPDRIKSLFKEGLVNGHYLFHGGAGIGKSTLSKILCKNHPYLYINASIDGKIDVLREKIEDFCVESQITDHDVNRKKVVWFDELDGVSQAFFDGLRGFIDLYQDNVRFIGTCNHFNKIPEPIKSRLQCINFNFESTDEERQIYEKYKTRFGKIIAGLKMNLATPDVLDVLCKNNFPDYRGILQTLQSLKKAEVTELTIDLIMAKQYEMIELYKLIISGKGKPEDIHKILMGDYATKAADVLKSLDKPFIDWIIGNSIQHTFLIPHIVILTAKYSQMAYNIDNALAMKACVFELMEIVKTK